MVERIRAWLEHSFTWWGHVFSVALSGLLLLQYVLWIGKEEALWWPETVVCVEWTLLLVGLVLIVPKLIWRWRAPLLIVVWLGLNALQSHARWLPLPKKGIMSYGQWLGSMFAQLTPYIWFSAGAGLVFIFACWWVTSKRRIYMWMIPTILFFCVRDSFSTLVLWPQVAMVLFCGLLLLVVRHFGELRRRAPKSWEYIAEYPSSIVVPVFVIMAVTIVLGVATPAVHPLLTDPYTLWKHARGEAVLIAGKGELSDWVAPAQDTSSGYGRNDRDLGGGFRFDYSPVFTVDASERSYWRGETRSVYTGDGWAPSDTERRTTVTNARVGTALRPESHIDASLVKTKEVVQTFQFNDGESFPVLFAAKTAQMLQDVSGGADAAHVLWAPEQSELRFRGERAAYPKQYTVVSQLPLVDEAALKTVTYPAELKEELPDYFQLPDKLPQRVRTLAEQVTQDAATPYDKVKKLEQYLAANYKYNNTPDLAKGKSHDFVDRFLFEIKEGYCDYFSTAMVVMTRSLGIPARWVKGYSTGTDPADSDLADGMLGLPNDVPPTGGGTFTVRNSDAHSWVEVYFPGYGWIPFEPTAGFTMPLLHPEAAPDPAIAVDSTSAAAAPAASGERYPLVLAASIVGALLVLGGAAFALWKFGALGRLFGSRKQHVNDFSQRVVLDFERLLRYCRRKGYRRDEHETLRESFARWVRQSRWLAPDLDVLLRLFEQAKYGSGAVDERDYQLALQTMQRLRAQLK